MLENPVNGRIIINGTQIGDTVSYECDTGYKLVGEADRTCNLVGLWTDSQPVCQREYLHACMLSACVHCVCVIINVKLYVRRSSKDSKYIELI